MAFLDETGLAELWSLTKDCVNWYVWEKSGTAEEAYIAESGTTVTKSIYFTNGTPVYTDFTYGEGVKIATDGTIQLTNVFTPQYQTNEAYWSYWNDLIPFYYMDSLGTIYKATQIVSSEPWYLAFVSTTLTIATREVDAIYGYVSSPDPNAYPINDGYTYVPMGQLGEKTRIATGSYTGTGNNSTTITLPFAPSFVILTGTVNGNKAVGIITPSFGTYILGGEVGDMTSYGAFLNDNVIGFKLWFNESGKTSNYIAIG